MPSIPPAPPAGAAPLPVVRADRPVVLRPVVVPPVLVRRAVVVPRSVKLLIARRPSGLFANLVILSRIELMVLTSSAGAAVGAVWRTVPRSRRWHASPVLRPGGAGGP